VFKNEILLVHIQMAAFNNDAGEFPVEAFDNEGLRV